MADHSAVIVVEVMFGVYEIGFRWKIDGVKV